MAIARHAVASLGALEAKCTRRTGIATTIGIGFCTILNAVVARLYDARIRRAAYECAFAIAHRVAFLIERAFIAFVSAAIDIGFGAVNDAVMARLNHAFFGRATK